MPSLKRDEAISRRELLNVDSYDVDLDLTRGPERFGSTVTIRFTCSRPGAGTFVEVFPEVLHEVVLNGVALDPAELRDGRFPLAGLATENELTVSADMAYSHSGEGLHRFTDPEDGLDYTYMMGFLDMASRVFACFEQPDLKAPYRLKVTAPEEWTVVANADGEQVSPGRWEFVESEPLATYFVTVVAGAYHSIYREHDGVRFGIHARQSYAEALDSDADEIFKVTHGCWDAFHRLYGVRYAFGNTYDQCFVPEFNAGAMENPGCVTFRDEAFMYRSAVTDTQRERRAMVIAHEMAHMWFGDLVSMRWWDDLWLNESFADCMAFRGLAEGTDFSAARASGAIDGVRGYAADERPSTHPVSGDVPESGEALNNFDGISYAKGGAVLNQLAAWVGDEAFFAGLRDYFGRFRYSNASLNDLIECIGRASGRDLADWSRRWLRTTGPSTLRLESQVSDGKYTAAQIVQTAPGSDSTLRPHRIQLGLYRIADGVAARAEQITIDVDGSRTDVPELVGLAVPEVLLINDDDLTYAKTRLDAKSLDGLPIVLRTLADPLARAMSWGVVADMVRDGELSPIRYLEILDGALPFEPHPAQVESALQFARSFVVDQCLTAGQRPDGLARVAAVARAVADRSDNLRLTALRYRIRCAHGDSGIEFLSGLLTRESESGVAIDTQLRWLILTRLVVLGAAGVDRIAAELERDPSSQGHNHAATCRASLPDADAKAAAWQAIMHGRDLSNHVLDATAAGFWWPEQAELTRDYESRFFTEAPAAFGERMPWEVMHLSSAMFPHYSGSPESVVADAEAMLARDDLVPELRRTVVDGLDDFRRAMRIRAGDEARG